ncbi:MAG: NAD-dependent succinate-semialdehyde dehydrogenase [Haliscomenobacteraceae bacterium CHB4]|nr:Glutarate-semialdehyde dehydrogenase DavD [Saprospiraceae bacterium]MCE7922587.1 NAD-dependent succinate-semialdehyde dehydrogenase [Haliscomenobacteraceae bacterium CHB4]
MSFLKDSSLLHREAFVNGEWLTADSGKTFAVTNPATGEILAQVADLGAEETQRAIAAAEAALPDWRSKTATSRAHTLRRWYDLILEHAEDLALLMTLEQGKPLAESRGEVRYGASFIEWFAEEGKRAYGDIIPPHQAGLRLLVTKQPVGVVAAITPWNFPNAMITRKVAPALAAGCTVVLKPSEETPLSALALVELAQRAGFPPGVLNIVTGLDAPSIGKALTDSPVVRKLSFTGSTEVGKLLMRQCAGTVKKISLELGGNAPFIVFNDADLDAAVEGAISSKYRNAGQTCVCANRIFVQSAVYEDFLERFTAAVQKQKVGPGIEQGVNIGPLINGEALEKVTRLVGDAAQKGARLLTGGHAMQGTFYEPTVLADVDSKMDIMHEEIFGPVAPVTRFDTEQEVIAMANDTPYGLAAYFYGRDIGRVFRVAEALDYGMVGVNTGLVATTVAPFGGMKESGIGREGSKYGLEEFLEVKYVCLGGI